jgi:hypothetical protein
VAILDEALVHLQEFDFPLLLSFTQVALPVHHSCLLTLAIVIILLASLNDETGVCIPAPPVSGSFVKCFVFPFWEHLQRKLVQDGFGNLLLKGRGHVRKGVDHRHVIVHFLRVGFKLPFLVDLVNQVVESGEVTSKLLRLFLDLGLSEACAGFKDCA